MSTLYISILLLIFGLLGSAMIILVFKEGRIELDPASAAVVKNIWSGKASALLPGTSFIIPGWEKRLVDVTLKNEPSDQPKIKVITADPAELEVDYVIFSQKIPFDPDGKDPAYSDTIGDIIKAGTMIDYKKRQEAINDRIKGQFQVFFGKKRLIEIYGENLTSKEADENFVSDANDEINDRLEEEIHGKWGIEVKIRIENINLPEKIQEAIEETIIAKREGQAIKDKAEAAGVPAWLIAVGDIFYDLSRSKS